MSFELLLIVPYGIETTEHPYCSASFVDLLIVPYGIETFSPMFPESKVYPSFNRTLWN